MPTPTIPNSITDLDPIAANNSPKGSDDTGGAIDDLFRAHAAIIRKQFSVAESVPSAENLPVPAEGSFLKVTKSATEILTFSDAFPGRAVYLCFEDGITLRHSAALILPAAADIVTQADDTLMFVNEEAGVWRCLAGWKIDAGKMLAKVSNLDDLEDKEVARANLGLGSAALATIQTGYADTNLGRAMIVGGFGLGAGMVSQSTNISAGSLQTGFYYISADAPYIYGGGRFTLNMNYGGDKAGWRLSNEPYTNRLFISGSNSSGSVALKKAAEVYTTDNKPAWGDVQDKPSTFAPTVSGTGTAISQLAVGAVGTYALLTDLSTTSGRSPGATVAGSNLRYSNTYSDTGTAPPGSWRLMGMTTSADNNNRHTSLWLRYA